MKNLLNNNQVLYWLILLIIILFINLIPISIGNALHMTIVHNEMHLDNPTDDHHIDCRDNTYQDITGNVHYSLVGTPISYIPIALLLNSTIFFYLYTHRQKNNIKDTKLKTAIIILSLLGISLFGSEILGDISKGLMPNWYQDEMEYCRVHYWDFEI